MLAPAEPEAAVSTAGVGVTTTTLVTGVPFDVYVVGTVVGRGGGTTLPWLLVVYKEVGSETGFVQTSNVHLLLLAAELLG